MFSSEQAEREHYKDRCRIWGRRTHLCIGVDCQYRSICEVAEKQ